jgi:hypothetical protein
VQATLVDEADRAIDLMGDLGDRGGALDGEPAPSTAEPRPRTSQVAWGGAIADFSDAFLGEFRAFGCSAC